MTLLPMSREDMLNPDVGVVGGGGGGGATGVENLERSTFGTRPMNLTKSREELESQPKINFDEKNKPLHGSFFKGLIHVRTFRNQDVTFDKDSYTVSLRSKTKHLSS